DQRETSLNRKAHAVFNTIISLETRLDVIDALMAEEGLTPLELETWNRCSLRLRKLYKRRHGLAHFSVVYSIESRDQVGHLISPFWTFASALAGEHQILDKPQIDERTDHFLEMVGAISHFHSEARRRRGQQQGNPTPIAPIVARFQASAAQILAELERKQPKPQAE